MYPQVPLGIRYDLFTGQIAHVFVADFRKTGKEKQVAVVFVFGTLQSRRLKNPQFLLAEKGSRFRRSGIAAKCERIPRHKTVFERNFHHVIPTIHVATYASRLRTADSFQIDVILLDERLFQFEQRNMVEVVLVFQKGMEMTQHRPIAPPVFVGVSASFVICLKKSCKCLMFKLGIWKFHFSFIYSNQSGTVKLFYLCFTPHPAEIP